jgi:hypothetical protein
MYVNRWHQVLYTNVQRKELAFNYPYQWSFEGNLWKDCAFLCSMAFTLKQPWDFWQVLLWQGLAIKGLRPTKD